MCVRQRSFQKNSNKGENRTKKNPTTSALETYLNKHLTKKSQWNMNRKISARIRKIYWGGCSFSAECRCFEYEPLPKTLLRNFRYLRNVPVYPPAARSTSVQGNTTNFTVHVCNINPSNGVRKQWKYFQTLSSHKKRFSTVQRQEKTVFITKLWVWYKIEIECGHEQNAALEYVPKVREKLWWIT